MKSPTISKLTVIDHEMIVHVYKPNTVPYGKIWNCVRSIWGYMYIYDLNYRWEKIKILQIIYALLWLKQNLNNIRKYPLKTLNPSWPFLWYPKMGHLRDSMDGTNGVLLSYIYIWMIKHTFCIFCLFVWGL